MEVTFTGCISVTDPSSVGESRRTALAIGQRLGFDDRRAGEFALLATEASRNILAHAREGQIILAGHNDGDSPLAQIVAIDKGPGIPDISRAMDDGFSTSGTMGAGLGAMKRMASTFEIFSGAGGTIVLLEVGEPARRRGIQIAGLACPYPGERVCGDDWIYHFEADRIVALICDGLGHGYGAAEAAREAVATFRHNLTLAPGEMLYTVHEALRKTRGAVAAVVEICPDTGKLTYSGVGNISCVLMNEGASRGLVSHNGTLGVATPRIQEFQCDWSPGATLILHSDGVQTRWDLSSYAGLLARHPAIIGGAIIRDFRRHRDDASVVVIKAA